MAGPSPTIRETCQIQSEASLVDVRGFVREAAVEGGFGIVDQTKLVTAASELARNIIRYADRGAMAVERVTEDGRTGVRVRFEDEGPGIVDVELALQDGYSTSGSLGIGLPGARRLVDDFAIESVVGQGTAVVITAWAR
jgi:serine/threonine-protein kinase RsbT